MADQKLTDLTALTSPTSDDLLYSVDDPSGSPLSRKLTIGNLFLNWPYALGSLSSAPTDWINQGSATIDTTYGHTIYTPSSTTSLKIRKKSCPATPYSIVACFSFGLLDTDYPHGGFVWRESSSGKLVSFDIVMDANIPKFQSNKWDSPTAYNSGYGNIGATIAPGNYVWLKIYDNGTTRYCYWSHNAGRQWLEVITSGHTDFITPDEVGFYVDSNNSGYEAAITLLSWTES